MKKTYQQPTIEIIIISLGRQMLAGSYILNVDKNELIEENLSRDIIRWEEDFDDFEDSDVLIH